MIALGTQIKVKGKYIRQTNDGKRTWYKLTFQPIDCIYLGRTVISEGELVGGFYADGEGKEAYLRVGNSITCAVVQEYRLGGRYLKPFYTPFDCIEEGTNE